MRSVCYLFRDISSIKILIKEKIKDDSRGS